MIATDTGRRSVYGPDGKPLTTINPTRSSLYGLLLAECERSHIYQLPGDVEAWASALGICPRCRKLGHASDRQVATHGG